MIARCLTEPEPLPPRLIAAAADLPTPACLALVHRLAAVGRHASVVAIGSKIEDPTLAMVRTDLVVEGALACGDVAAARAEIARTRATSGATWWHQLATARVRIADGEAAAVSEELAHLEVPARRRVALRLVQADALAVAGQLEQAVVVLRVAVHGDEAALQAIAMGPRPAAAAARALLDRGGDDLGPYR